ncbi:hypothetical protein FKM82_019378 [Ascaphus truei]
MAGTPRRGAATSSPLGKILLSYIDACTYGRVGSSIIPRMSHDPAAGVCALTGDLLGPCLFGTNPAASSPPKMARTCLRQCHRSRQGWPQAQPM